MRKWITIFLLCILPTPAFAGGLSATPFARVGYFHGWYGIDDGINHGVLFSGLSVVDESQPGFTGLVGVVRVGFAPTKHNGAIVKDATGGWGVGMGLSFGVPWSPRMRGKPIMSMSAVACYLDRMVPEPGSKQNRPGPIVYLTTDWELVAGGVLWVGWSFHSAYGGFPETVSIGGGLGVVF